MLALHEKSCALINAPAQIDKHLVGLAHLDKFKARVVDLSLVRGSQQTPSHPCAISTAATYSPNPASKTSSGGTRESLQLRIVA